MIAEDCFIQLARRQGKRTAFLVTRHNASTCWQPLIKSQNRVGSTACLMPLLLFHQPLPNAILSGRSWWWNQTAVQGHGLMLIECFWMLLMFIECFWCSLNAFCQADDSESDGEDMVVVVSPLDEATARLFNAFDCCVIPSNSVFWCFLPEHCMIRPMVTFSMQFNLLRLALLQSNIPRFACHSHLPGLGPWRKATHWLWSGVRIAEITQKH